MSISKPFAALGCAALAAIMISVTFAAPAHAVRVRPPPPPPPSNDVQCVSKDGDMQGPLTAGQAVNDLIYTIFISADLQTDNPVTIQDTLPTGAVFDAGNSSVNCADQGGGMVECTFDPLPAGQSSVMIGVDIANPQGDIVNVAQVIANAADNSSTANDGGPGTSCEDVIPVAPQGQAVLACEMKTQDPSTNPLVVGVPASILYNVSFVNTGDATATNVVVTDQIDGENTTYQSSNSTDDCGNLLVDDTITDGVPIDCPISDIPVGGANFSLSVNVTPTAVGTISNTAFATYDSPEGQGLTTNDCDVSIDVVEAPGGGEGCTPGGWRNHFDVWGPTGYSPTDDFVATFGLSGLPSGLPAGLVLGETALDEHDGAIWLGGGGNRKLARHGTACLLNAAHPGVDYNLTVAQCIEIVQNGGATDDGQFDLDDVVTFNEQGCNVF